MPAIIAASFPNEDRAPQRRGICPGRPDPQWYNSPLYCAAHSIPQTMFPASQTIQDSIPSCGRPWRPNAAPGRPHRADRIGELHQPARAPGAGLGAHQQVCGRLSRQALLRRLRIRRHRRAAGDRPRQGAVPLRLSPTCSRTRAPRPTRPSIWRLLKPGDTMLGMSLAHGGHLTHGSPVNFSGKLYKVVSYGLDRRTRRSTTTRSSDAGAGAPAQDDRRRRVGLCAGHRLEAVPRDRRQRGCLADGGHGPLRRPGCRRAVSQPDRASPISSPAPPTRRLRGPRGGFILAKAEHEKTINSAIFPGMQGGPLMHVIAAKAVALQGSDGRRRSATTRSRCWTMPA